MLLTLSAFDLRRENIPIPDETGVLQQQGDQRSRGIELDVAGTLQTDLFAFASYAFTDAELTEFRELVDYSFGQLPPLLVDRSGNRPAFAPSHVFNLWLDKEYRAFSLGGGARYLSRQFIAEDNAFAIDDALTFDATLGYRRGNWRLSLNLRNLTGTAYETRGFGSHSVIPGDPFALYLGLDVFR
jgi:iron complex outermembrane receptor protein